LAIEDERQQMQFHREQKMKAYHEKQKARLAEFGMIKAKREQEKNKAKQMEMENEINRRKAM
jgi:hypothetical protein